MIQLVVIFSMSNNKNITHDMSRENWHVNSSYEPDGLILRLLRTRSPGVLFEIKLGWRSIIPWGSDFGLFHGVASEYNFYHFQVIKQFVLRTFFLKTSEFFLVTLSLPGPALTDFCNLHLQYKEDMSAIKIKFSDFFFDNL